MIINLSELAPSQCYHLMTQTVIPRPIAWVLSVNDNGSHNLAPFSFFNALASEPPLVVLSIGKKPEGELKDTRRNLLSGRDCVIHIASVKQAALVTQSAASLAYGESELAQLGIDLVPFEDGLHRLADCAVAYRAKLYDSHEIGPNQQGIIYCELTSVYLADQAVSQEGGRLSISAAAIDPLARLGAAEYAGLSDTFTIDRPD